MSVINTNVNAIIAQNAGVKNSRIQTQAMQQLSTGNRINTASDDAAGLAISTKMTSQIRGLDQAVRNANDGISLIQTAEGALTEVNNMLQRMRELAIQSASDTNTASDRTALNAEFVALRDEINRIGNNTQFNGMNVLDGSFDGGNGQGKFVFQVGANGGQTIDITMANYTTNSVAAGSAGTSQTSILSLNGGTVGTVADDFAAGDVITMTITPTGGTATTATYEVVAADLDTTGSTDAEKVANTKANVLAKIAENVSISGYSLSASNQGLTVTESGTTGFTATIVNTTDSGELFSSVETITTAAVASSGGGTAQQSTLTLSGEFREGDVLTFTPSDGSLTGDTAVSALNYTVTADDIGSTVADTRTNVAAKLAALQFDGYTMSAADGVISVAGTDSSSFNASLSVATTSLLSTTENATDSTVTFDISTLQAGDTITFTNGGATYSATLGGALGSAATNTTVDAALTSIATLAGTDVFANGATDIVDNVATMVDETAGAWSVSRANGAVDGSLNANPGETQYDTVDYVAAASGGGTLTGDLNMINSSDITTQNSANTAVGSIDSAIAVVSGGRATMGATINRLNYAADNLMATSANVSASRSRVQDTDYSQATTELARTQIIQQASTAMLAQANQSAQSVLSLLK